MCIYTCANQYTDMAPLPSPTVEWQDRLAASLGPSSGYASSNSSNYGNSTNRRRLEGPSYDWDGMYTMEGSDGGTGACCPTTTFASHLTSFSDGGESNEAEGEDNASAMGQLSLDENREVRYHGKASGLHLLQSRGNDRKEGGLW